VVVRFSGKADIISFFRLGSGEFASLTIIAAFL